MTDLPKRLTAEEAAEYLCCQPSTIETEAAAGNLRGAKIGSGWIFKAEDVVEYWDKRIDQQQAKISSKRKPPAAKVNGRNQPPSLS